MCQSANLVHANQQNKKTHCTFGRDEASLHLVKVHFRLHSHQTMFDKASLHMCLRSHQTIFALIRQSSLFLCPRQAVEPWHCVPQAFISPGRAEPSSPCSSARAEPSTPSSYRSCCNVQIQCIVLRLNSCDDAPLSSKDFLLVAMAHRLELDHIWPLIWK